MQLVYITLICSCDEQCSLYEREGTLSCGSVPKHKLWLDSSNPMSNQELEYQVLKLLENNPHFTQRQLAEELGVILGKTHYLIKSLTNVGWVKLHNFQKSENKWGYAYLLTPKGIVEKSIITSRFLKRKQTEYNQLRKEIEQLKEEVINQTQSIKD